jgi:hypothetical protein
MVLTVTVKQIIHDMNIKNITGVHMCADGPWSCKMVIHIGAWSVASSSIINISATYWQLAKLICIPSSPLLYAYHCTKLWRSSFNFVLFFFSKTHLSTSPWCISSERNWEVFCLMILVVKFPV